MAKAEKQATLMDQTPQPKGPWCDICAGRPWAPGQVVHTCAEHTKDAGLVVRPEAITPPTLWQKIAAAMKAVGYVQKKGKNKEQNYSYVTAADVAEKAREAFTDVGLLMLPTVKTIETRERPTKSGGVATFARVTMGYRVTDVSPSPQYFTRDDGIPPQMLLDIYQFDMVGEGMDSGDKAVAKAITSAFKYALMQLLMISTGDDPEADASTDKDPPVEPKITDAQLFALQALIHQTDTDPAKVCQFFHVEDLAALTADQYDRAAKMLEKKK